jgi:acyl-CoA synthetase (NDP forming)
VSVLDAFFRPESVAIVGAAERETSSGGAVLRMARLSGYRGKLIPVNQKGGEILGFAAKTSLREVDPPADLVVIVVRPDLILDVVREAGETGHKRVLILPGGFAEAGEAGLARDTELRRIASSHGITVAGPNCAGIIDQLDSELPFAATFLRDMPRGGGVAFISQSGAIVEQVIAKSHEMGLPIGAVVSVGNAMHLGVAEFLEHYGADERCKVVALYVESFGELERFKSIARSVAMKKPVVALVGGRSAPGVGAVKRHTGGDALGDSRLDATLAECGVLRAPSLRRMLVACKGLGAFPRGIGQRILLLSNSGGPGVLATDSAAREGLLLPELPQALAERLRVLLPGEAAVANPLDLLADAREDRFGETLRLALEHGRSVFDAVLMLHVVPFMVDASPVVARLAEMAREAGMPFMHSMMGTLPAKVEWFATLEAAGVPAFDDAEEMAVAAAFAARYREQLRRLRASNISRSSQ